MRLNCRRHWTLAWLVACIGYGTAPVRAQTLEDIVRQAVRTHPQVRAQIAAERAAQKGIEGAQWQFYPTPSASVESVNSSTTDPSYRGDSQVTILRLQQPLWTGGRLTAGLEKAQANLSLAQANADEARQQIGLRVIQAYAEWLASDLKIQAWERSLASHQKLLQQAQNRIREGLSPASDLTLVQGRTGTTEAELSLAKVQQTQALSRLTELAGHGVRHDELRRHRDATDSLPLTDLASSLDMASTQSPLIRKHQAQLRLAQINVAERKSDTQPDVFLRAERQMGSYSYSGIGPQTRAFVGLSSKLGAGLSTLAGIDSALANVEASQEELTSQARTLREQVLADHAQALSFQDRAKYLKSSLSAAQEVFESFERQFPAGRKSWLDLMTAARELAQSEVMMADLISQQLLITWRLALVTQSQKTLNLMQP
jgi:adhesin transport system outer membrane protein